MPTRFFIQGRMISGSKSAYSAAHPDNVVVFNANIVTANGRKVWYGDLDLTLDKEELIKLSIQMDETLHVLREHDGRFGNEEAPKIERAVATITRSNFQFNHEEQN